MRNGSAWYQNLSVRLLCSKFRGLSQLDLVLPREEASLSMECGHFPCSGSRINLAVSDLTVKR